MSSWRSPPTPWSSGRVEDCEFDLGIFMNLTQDHLDFHGTMEDYYASKKRFFTDLLAGEKNGRRQGRIINIDDPWGRRLAEELGAKGLTTFGIDSIAFVQAKEVELSLGEIRAEIETPAGAFPLRAPFSGRFNLYNILAATAAAFHLGIPLSAIQRGIECAKPVPGRLEKISESGEPAVFVDYAHSEDALKRVLQNLARFRQGRIITVFGCGGDRDRGKRPLMGRAAAEESDLVIVTSDNPRTEEPLAIIRRHRGRNRRRRDEEIEPRGDPRRGRRENLYRGCRQAGGHRDGRRPGESGRHRPDRRQGSRGLPDPRNEYHPLRRPDGGPRGPGQAAREGKVKKISTPRFSTDDVLKATGGSLVRPGRSALFDGVSTDTRTIAPASLFVPLAGARFDGHDYIGQAVGAGAAGVLVQRGREGLLEKIAGEATVISVEDTLTALGDLARFWRARFSIPVVAVTGSSGKTTTKEMAAAILGREKHLLKNVGNLNNLVGLPLTLFQLNEAHEVAVLEMGTNRRGEIARLTEIAGPTVGVITNVGPAHLEGLKSLETIRKEKGDLFRVMNNRGTAVINLDDEALAPWAEKWKGEKITFAIEADADVTASRIAHEGEKGTIFSLLMDGASREILLPVLGFHNVSNALAAAAASSAAGAAFDAICQGLMAFKPVGGRMEVYRLKNGGTLIDDTYNANPASVAVALKTLQGLKGECRSTVILGDMLELGGEAEKYHEEIGRNLADTGVSKAYLRGDFARATAKGAMKRGMKGDQVLIDLTTEETVAHLKACLKAGDWVLVKGSRKMKMEEIVQAILGAIGVAK